MLNKEQIRKKYFKIRKNNYFEVDFNFIKPLLLFLNKIYKKKIFLSLYYPANNEVNILPLFDEIKKTIIPLLPVVGLKNNMKFFKWDYLDPLNVNKYGMLEPLIKKKSIIPHVALVPLLAFDKKNNRLGYGKGYYDKFLNKYLKTNKRIITIGVAFSFQKYNKLPTSQKDISLDYILTEKGLK